MRLSYVAITVLGCARAAITPASAELDSGPIGDDAVEGDTPQMDTASTCVLGECAESSANTAGLATTVTADDDRVLRLGLTWTASLPVTGESSTLHLGALADTHRR